MFSKQKIGEFYSPNEKSLTVVNQNYQLIDEDAFVELTDLEILNFSSNKLQKLNPNLFFHLTKLKTLILSSNSISSLPAKIFSSLTLLEQFEMTNCNLSSIDSTSFKGLINLKRIILANNNLEFIHPDTFLDLFQLEVAVFSFNKLEAIHPETFKNQQKLKRLNLKANNIKNIEKNLFINLTNLEQVILSVNNLSSIDNIFENNSNLQRLIMYSNKIEQLTKLSFKGLDKIFSIDIANNLIEEIDDEAFCGMHTLKYLDMSRNYLKTINKSVFNDLTSLDELILSKNAIETLDQDLFQKNVNLRLLRLDFNQITYLKPNILTNLNCLLEISCNTMNVNNMKELQEKIVNFNKTSFVSNIEYINSFGDLNIILNSYDALEILQRLSLFTNRHKVELFSTIQPQVLETLTKILIKIIEDIYQDLSSHVDNFKPYVKNAKCYRLRFLSYIVSIFKNWSKTIKLFCKYFDDFSGLEIALKYLNCNVLKNNILKKKESDSKYSYMILVDIYGDLLNLVYNSIVNDQMLKKKFIDFNCFDSLIEAAETLNNVSDLDFKTYLIISEIIDDELNLKRLKNIKKVMENLVSNIKTCVNRLNENDQNVDRCPMVVDNIFIENCLIFEVNNNFYYLTDFLTVLYNFAINDQIKFDIYETYSMKNVIKTLVQKGNNYEKEISLKLLCQLCFDKRVLTDADSDREFFLPIKILSKQKPSSENENIIKNAKSIIWLMQKNYNSLDDPRSKYGLFDMRFREKDKNMIDKKYSKEKNQNESADNQNQIMISYNSKSRSICLNIKEELEKNGYKVWIDVESIYGSSLESMANAIETSFCILMCITENYKESNFCRLEAEYCIQKNRPFIPLILQKGYRPNGWLGIILGTKIFIDFTKHDFEKALFEVNRNLSLIKSSLNKTKTESVKSDQIESNINQIESKKSATPENQEPVESSWNENQVEDWLRRVEIDQIIINHLIPCNGQILYQLYMILKWNPEFYYHSLKTPASSFKDLKNLAIFTNELKKLFE